MFRNKTSLLPVVTASTNTNNNNDNTNTKSTIVKPHSGNTSLCWWFLCRYCTISWTAEEQHFWGIVRIKRARNSGECETATQNWLRLSWCCRLSVANGKPETDPTLFFFCRGLLVFVYRIIISRLRCSFLLNRFGGLIGLLDTTPKLEIRYGRKRQQGSEPKGFEIFLQEETVYFKHSK